MEMRRWFALNRKAKLPAAACDASGGHGSAPWPSICVSKLAHRRQGVMFTFTESVGVSLQMCASEMLLQGADDPAVSAYAEMAA
jgi:hypothetical protein